MQTLKLLIVAVIISLAFVSATSAQIEIRGEINGRIMTDDNKPARRVNIMVMDLTTLEVRNVISNDFGYYRVRDLRFGNVFIVGANGKGYYFAIPFQTVTLNLITREVMFTASKFPPPSAVEIGIDDPLVVIAKEQ